jgi:hypothetical protein
VLYTCVVSHAECTPALAGALCRAVAACLVHRSGAAASQVSARAPCAAGCSCLRRSARRASSVRLFRSLTAACGALAVAAFRIWGCNSVFGVCAALLCSYCTTLNVPPTADPHCVVHVAAACPHAPEGKAVTAAAARASRTCFNETPRYNSIARLGFAWWFALMKEPVADAAGADLACVPQLGVLLSRCACCGEWRSFGPSDIGTPVGGRARGERWRCGGGRGAPGRRRRARAARATA